MNQKREALIAYLQKNLAIAEEQIAEIDVTKKKIDEFKRAIDELEKKLLAMDDEKTLRSNIEEIKGFVEDLTIEPTIKDENAAIGGEPTTGIEEAQSIETVQQDAIFVKQEETLFGVV